MVARAVADDLDLDAGVLLVRDGPTGDRSLALPGETLEMFVRYVADVRPSCPSSDRLFANPRASFDSPGHGQPAATARYLRLLDGDTAADG